MHNCNFFPLSSLYQSHHVSDTSTNSGVLPSLESGSQLHKLLRQVQKYWQQLSKHSLPKVWVLVPWDYYFSLLWLKNVDAFSLFFNHRSESAHCSYCLRKLANLLMGEARIFTCCYGMGGWHKIIQQYWLQNRIISKNWIQ